MAKRRASGELEAAAELYEEHTVEIKPLGAGQEVGRSCIIVKYMEKRVMLDCGIHPGHSGLASLPYLDEEDLSQIDAALITHFHLDHVAAVPYLIGKTNFKGRLLMTHPTKAIMHTLLSDFVRVSAGSAGDEQLYGEADLEAALARAEVIDFDQTLDLGGIKVTAYRAGHVLGAAMFLLDIAGMTCLYTGDYSRIADRHLAAADTPPVTPHIVIVEATYGVSRHLPRDVREKRFLDKIHATVLRGGRVLLPIVALGRAQELLLMLEEYWNRHPALQGVPIYQASGLARKALSVYQTYIEMMNDDVKAAFHTGDRNPFNFKHVQLLKGASQFDDSGPCVMMATPSMLQSGLSRDLFEAWCEEERNAVIIADFAVQGTLAREILSNPSHIITKAGVRLPLRCQVDAISFSAHADFEQTSGFLDAVAPPHVVLVHGEAGEMLRLKQALERSAAQRKVPRLVYNPKVAQSLLIPFKPRHTAFVVGALADAPTKPGCRLRGVLLRRPFGAPDAILAPDDLPRFTKLYTGSVAHRQAIIMRRPFSELRLALEVVFEGVEGGGALPVRGAGGEAAVSVGGVVTVKHRPGDVALGYESHVVVEWEGGTVGDMVADAVVAVILAAAGEPAGAAAADAARRRALADGDADAAAAAELRLSAELLRAQFGPTEVDEARGVILLRVDAAEVVVDGKTGKVVCEDEGLRERVGRALARMAEAMRPAGLDEAAV